MDKKYFQVNFDGSVKPISRQAYLKKYETVEAGESDIILWYDDGVNIFIGDCACDVKSVMYAVVKMIGVFNANYYEAGEID